MNYFKGNFLVSQSRSITVPYAIAKNIFIQVEVLVYSKFLKKRKSNKIQLILRIFRFIKLI